MGSWEGRQAHQAQGVLGRSIQQIGFNHDGRPTGRRRAGAPAAQAVWGGAHAGCGTNTGKRAAAAAGDSSSAGRPSSSSPPPARLGLVFILPQGCCHWVAAPRLLLLVRRTKQGRGGGLGIRLPLRLALAAALAAAPCLGRPLILAGAAKQVSLKLLSVRHHAPPAGGAERRSCGAGPATGWCRLGMRSGRQCTWQKEGSRAGMRRLRSDKTALEQRAVAAGGGEAAAANTGAQGTLRRLHALLQALPLGTSGRQA